LDRCKTYDFSVFLDLWNVTQNQQTPMLHFKIAHWLQKCWEHGETRLLLQAFRASGKSTIVGLFTAWILWRDPDLRILVLSAESILAQKMVRTIRKVIERHPLTKHLKPKNPDQWAGDSFTVIRKNVSRDPSVLAKGLNANITGTRANVIICDDVEVPNTCDTADKREKLRDRLAENDFILVPGGTQIYIGTPHSYYSIYAKQPRKEIGESDIFLKNFKRLSIPILNKENVIAWPERYKHEDIEQMRLMSGPMKFASQMLLQPVNILKGRLDPSLLQSYADDICYLEVQKTSSLSIGGNKIVSASAWWDPSFGSANGDASVIAVIFTDDSGVNYLHHISYIKVLTKDDDDEATLQCREVCKIAREFYLPSIAVETNGIGKFLPAILRREMGKARLPCTVIEKVSRKSKDSRILESFDAIMAAQSLYVQESVYKTPFIREMQEWRPGLAGAKDDGLDAVAGALSLEPVRIQRINGNATRLWRPHGDSYTAKTDFDV
jgi:hypothetical protein